MGALRTFVLEKYSSVQVHKIVLGFATAFLKNLSKTRFNANYLSFAVFLDLPKTVRVRKAITERIVTRADIALLFKRIESCAENGKINAQKARNYRAFGLLASYTGLRPSTLQRLTVGQFKAALNEEKPVLHVLAEQEKSRVEHYVPLHPLVVNAISDVLFYDFGEKDDFEILHRVIWADGSIHWVQVQGRSTKREGSGRRVNGTVVDVTDRRLAEAERDRLIRELEEKNAELERFTYTVSHDLKSPLITVRGFLGSIERDVGDGRYDRLGGDVERILSATERMQKLLDELLNLSRIGRIVSPPQRLAFADLVQEAMDMVRGRLDAAHARVEAQEGLPDVYGDRSRLVQVLLNLLDNSAKFLGSQKTPRIVVGSRPAASDGRPVFFVQDNGEGVAPENLGRMVGLFEKLDDRSRGTGVGLAIVKRIVEVHGGKLWVESPGRGQGTTVCFTLPTRAPV